MAAETSLVDALKAIPAILKLIPDTQTLPALTVLVVLVIVVAILRTDILKQLSQEQRDAAVMFIIRYVFVGAGMICIVSFTYAVVSIKSASAQLQNGITKPASTAEKTPGSPVPIVSSDAIAKLSDSLVLLSYRLNPPPGIEDALAQLKAGNAKPAIDILNNNILAEQKDKSSRAPTLRQIGLLEFYKDTQASLATYQQSVLLDPDSWEAWGQIAYLLERSGDHAGAAVVRGLFAAGNPGARDQRWRARCPSQYDRRIPRDRLSRRHSGGWGGAGGRDCPGDPARSPAER